MAGELTLTAVGNLTGDPELRYTPSGAPVVAFTLAVNPREYDRQANEWKDGEPSFVRVSAWRQLAENVAESLRKGDRVVVTGRWREERWEKEGEKHSAWKLTADSVGAELSFATATVKRTVRRSGDVAPDDPWATASSTRPAASASTGSGFGSEEPPF